MFQVESLKHFATRWGPLLALLVAASAVWVLWDQLHSDDIHAALTTLASFPLETVLAGLASCAGCYLLVGLYEGVAVRHASGRRAWLQPFVTATIANPIGHMVAFAVLSAAALRYRLHGLLGLSAKQIGAVVVLVAMPYLLGIGWLIDIALLAEHAAAARALHVTTATVLALGVIGLAKDIGWIVFVARRREPIAIGSWSIRVPGLGATLVQIAFGIGHVVFTAGVMYAFMPPDLDMSFATFLVLFLLAMLVGQVSHVPAGLGVFEAALLLLMPSVPRGELLAAVLAYRAIFELLPLAVAVALLAAREIAARTAPASD
jgi:phosphatidylglycerol lysyltransferase